MVVLGFSALIAYEMIPGGAGRPVADLSRIESRGYTLVMVAHPRCPCTRASVTELSRLMTRLPERLTATVWFYVPAGELAEWAQTGLWKSAAVLPHVAVKADFEGRMAAKLGLETSGHVLLFDPTGRRVFSGGITGTRGHEGDNAGRGALEALVLGQTAEPATTPVFGCAIRDALSDEAVALAQGGAGETGP